MLYLQIASPKSSVLNFLDSNSFEVIISIFQRTEKVPDMERLQSMEECEKLYRLMCFNVFAHNRDDHSKNFSYIYRDEEKRWILSPAYDLTYSNSIGGEHATTVNGNGADPGMDDLLSVAKKIGLGMTKARKTAAEIQECVQERLRDYLSDRIE